MPKDTTEHVQRNQKQRIRIREKSKFYSPGTVNLQVRKEKFLGEIVKFKVSWECFQVLGSGARGSSSSIYLFSEQAR
jgi:hypothetical protein